MLLTRSSTFSLGFIILLQPSSIWRTHCSTLRLRYAHSLSWVPFWCYDGKNDCSPTPRPARQVNRSKCSWQWSTDTFFVSRYDWIIRSRWHWCLHCRKNGECFQTRNVLLENYLPLSVCRFCGFRPPLRFKIFSNAAVTSITGPLQVLDLTGATQAYLDNTSLWFVQGVSPSRLSIFVVLFPRVIFVLERNDSHLQDFQAVRSSV